MPNNTNERKGKQAGSSAEERFRNFFSTSVIDLPEEMTRRDEPAPVEEKPKAGLLGKLFSHDKEETPAPAQPVLEIPTGEILLGQMQSRYSRSRRTWRWNCVPQTLFRQCRCSPPAQSLPRQFRQSRCLHQGDCCRAAGAGKARAPAGAAACCSPKSSLRRRTPRRRCCRRNWSSGRCSS